MATVKNIIQPYHLNLNLPRKVLNLKVNDELQFDKVTTEIQVLPFKEKNKINLKEFKCYFIKGNEDLIILCPTNNFHMVAICKYTKDRMVGTIYNNVGKIVGHY